ncbi:hypothetical protein ABVT39_018764 [Epinephelus coioides]
MDPYCTHVCNTLQSGWSLATVPPTDHVRRLTDGDACNKGRVLPVAGAGSVSGPVGRGIVDTEAWDVMFITERDTAAKRVLPVTGSGGVSGPVGRGIVNTEAWDVMSITTKRVIVAKRSTAAARKPKATTAKRATAAAAAARKPKATTAKRAAAAAAATTTTNKPKDIWRVGVGGVVDALLNCKPGASHKHVTSTTTCRWPNGAKCTGTRPGTKRGSAKPNTRIARHGNAKAPKRTHAAPGNVWTVIVHD